MSFRIPEFVRADDIAIGHTISKPTLVVGDLHGKLKALQENLEALNVLRNRKDWATKGVDLVLAGDIFADRGQDDFELARFILNLLSQIEAEGDRLHLLIGNHDLEALNFLVGGLVQPFRGIHDHSPSKSGKPTVDGIRVLARLLEPERDDRTLEEIFGHRPQDTGFLARFMGSEEGNAVGTVLGMMKPRLQIGNVLFQHTPPSTTTMELMDKPTLTEGFSERVQQLLTGGDPFTSIEERNAWVEHLTGWVSANNRFERMEGTDFQPLLGKGLSVVCYGHDYSSVGHSPFSQGSQTIHCVGVDYGYGRNMGTRKEDRRYSVSVFMPDGKVWVEFEVD